MTTGEVTNKVAERRTAWKVVIPRPTWSFVRLPLPRHWLLLTECAAGVWLASLRPFTAVFPGLRRYVAEPGMTAYRQTFQQDVLPLSGRKRKFTRRVHARPSRTGSAEQ